LFLEAALRVLSGRFCDDRFQGRGAARNDEPQLDGMVGARIRAEAKRAAEYKHVAVEVPLGSAQIKYDAGLINGFPKAACCVA